MTLIGTGSDPDTGDSLSYAWTQTGGTPTVTLADSPTPTATFTAPDGLTDDTRLTFTLTVTDSQSPPATATDTVSITILAGSVASTIDGDLLGNVIEDADPNTATGSLTTTAPGGAVGTFQPMPNTVGTYGSFTLATGGDWTYTLDNLNPATTPWPRGRRHRSLPDIGRRQHPGAGDHQGHRCQ